MDKDRRKRLKESIELLKTNIQLHKTNKNYKAQSMAEKVLRRLEEELKKGN